MMKKIQKHNDKTIEQTDYDLKARNKFPPDKEYPETEQNKQDAQNRTTKKQNQSKNVHKESNKNNKIEQNPGTRGNNKKRVY